MINYDENTQWDWLHESQYSWLETPVVLNNETKLIAMMLDYQHFNHGTTIPSKTGRVKPRKMILDSEEEVAEQLSEEIEMLMQV